MNEIPELCCCQAGKAYLQAEDPSMDARLGLRSPSVARRTLTQMRVAWPMVRVILGLY